MSRVRSVAAVLVAGLSLLGFAQSAPQADPMTAEDLRAYMDALHLKQVEEQAVRAQMDAQKAKLPPWWPADVTETMVQQMLNVDSAALEFPFVKSCMSSSELHTMMALFSTPEGKAYVQNGMGQMVQKEANGASAEAAHQQAMKEDKGLPPAALNHLPPPQRQVALRVLQHGALQCMSSGFSQGGAAVADARTKIAQQVVQEHRAELQAAKQKYDQAHQQ